MSALTLRELAGRLDLSIATVSRALAGDRAIAAGTRERVAEAARRYGYVPNIAARQLVSGRSGFAGFVMPVRGPDFIDPYLGEFVTGLGEGLVEHGLDLFVATVPAGRGELSVLRHVVESGRADGIVVPRIGETDQRLDYLTARNFPCVAHGRLLDATAEYNWLDTDSVLAFGEAFELLYGLGHRHFGLVSISDAMTFRHMRERGLREAMSRRGDPGVTLDIVNPPRFDRGATIAAINSLLHRERRLDFPKLNAVTRHLHLGVFASLLGIGCPAGLAVNRSGNLLDSIRPLFLENETNFMFPILTDQSTCHLVFEWKESETVIHD